MCYHVNTMTSTEPRHWPSGGHEELFAAIASMKTPEEAARLLRDRCTVSELDAGLGPVTPGDRALAFPCRNAPVEALLVRADDIPEYLQDGVVDCGITGLDIVRERGADVVELLQLGFGACTLEAAVPQESPLQ